MGNEEGRGGYLSVDDLRAALADARGSAGVMVTLGGVSGWLRAVSFEVGAGPVDLYGGRES